MNGIEKIKEKILSDARREAEEVIRKAEQEAAAILAQAEAEASGNLAQSEAKAQAEAEILKKRISATASLEDRKQVLKTRQDMVAKAFELALDKLGKLPEDQYRKMMEYYLLQAVRDGEGQILVNEADSKNRLGPEFINGLNRLLKEKGREASLSLAPSGEFLSSKGGAVLRYGDLEINCTLEILLNLEKNRLEADVAAVLFKND